MATFSTSDIMRLRKLTGSGMMDVKKALTEADGDFDAAIEALRIKGAKDVTKRAGRTTANGLVAQTGNALLELNSETDFVAKNEAFVSLAQKLVDHAAATKPGSVEDFLASQLDGETVSELVGTESAKIGEKLAVNRVANLDGDVSVYMHRKDPDLPPQVGVLVAYTGDAEVARSIGMQIAAMRPKFLSRDEVPAENVENERRVAEQSAREEGKPERAIEKIVEGKVNAYFKDFVLLDQSSVSDDKKSVAKVLEEANTTVTGFAHFEVGRE